MPCKVVLFSGNFRKCCSIHPCFIHFTHQLNTGREKKNKCRLHSPTTFFKMVSAISTPKYIKHFCTERLTHRLTSFFFYHSSLERSRTSKILLRTFIDYIRSLSSYYFQIFSLVIRDLNHALVPGALYLVMPITPQAIRAPAFPVFRLSSSPPFPKSSLLA